MSRDVILRRYYRASPPRGEQKRWRRSGSRRKGTVPPLVTGRRLWGGSIGRRSLWNGGAEQTRAANWGERFQKVSGQRKTFRSRGGAGMARAQLPLPHHHIHTLQGCLQRDSGCIRISHFLQMLPYRFSFLYIVKYFSEIAYHLFIY